MAFLTESWDPQRNDLSEGNKEGTKPREGDRAGIGDRMKGVQFNSSQESAADGIHKGYFFHEHKGARERFVYAPMSACAHTWVSE